MTWTRQQRHKRRREGPPYPHGSVFPTKKQMMEYIKAVRGQR
jgi:hypothetical protein